MQMITLDFSEIKNTAQLHDYLAEVFSLPEDYGRNLDALWDCLLFSFPEPTAIFLKNADRLPEELQKTALAMGSLFDDLQNEDKNVTVQIL